MKTARLTIASLPLLQLALAGSSTAQVIPAPQVMPAAEFTIVQSKINPVQNPKDLVLTLNECLHNETCKNAVNSLAYSFGIDLDLVTTIFSNTTKVNRKGEESWFHVALPIGYEYCRSELNTLSVVPNTGDRSPFMGAKVMKDRLDFYTWTPTRNMTEGRSWIDANLTIIGVRFDVAQQYRENGKCNKSTEHLLVECRGGSGVNKGKPACGTVKD